MEPTSDAEDGEISETNRTYNEALEWPGGTSNASTPNSNTSSLGYYDFDGTDTPTTTTASLRLVVQRSTVLRARIAVLGGNETVEIGRDAAPAANTARIRLKEMSVSKLHASIYWDPDMKSWAIVDHGSMHGTFIKPSNNNQAGEGIRLSPSRSASVPRILNHLDILMLGSTEFAIHIHEDGNPCELCAVQGGEKIVSLFPAKSKHERTPIHSVVPTAPAIPKDPKKALSSLKQSLLTRHRGVSSTVDTQYVDRSARRRAQYPSSRPDVPGRTTSSSRSLPSSALTSTTPSSSASPISWEPPITVSQPATPLASNNIGHRLLMKQGWQPGSSLGSDLTEATATATTSALPDSRISLIEPLQASGPSMRRAGLGMHDRPATAVGSTQNWREAGKRQRWDDLDKQ